ncbi:hypothetical protein NL676_006589 [Syzygium grande]|nr:hypothetical protein NL676_006589 [Syzygium grande]
MAGQGWELGGGRRTWRPLVLVILKATVDEEEDNSAASNQLEHHHLQSINNAVPPLRLSILELSSGTGLVGVVATVALGTYVTVTDLRTWSSPSSSGSTRMRRPLPRATETGHSLHLSPP